MGMKSALEIPFKHIAVEGVFRSKKTQLANVLAQRIGGKVVLDNVGNPYLKDFYNEREGSAYNFERANTEHLFRHFADAEAECKALLALDPPLVLPAYEQCIKASHRFNLLDARGVIGVTERAAYIGRVRTLARGCCEAWLASHGRAA